jgi:uncharacterized protein YecT (DUF1311 family)
MKWIRNCLPFVVAIPTMVVSGTAQTDWRTRAVENFERADRELNDVWQQMLAQIEHRDLPAKIKADFVEQQRKAQRAWIEFRNEDARVAQYDWWGGSGAGAAEIGWKQTLTENRILQLRDRYLLDKFKQ